MRLQLINSPLPAYMSTCLRSKCYPPLHIVSLATYIKNIISDIEINILDGEILGIDEVIRKANADVIGISSNTLSYESAVDIATRIKQKSKRTRIIRKIRRNQEVSLTLIKNRGY